MRILALTIALFAASCAAQMQTEPNHIPPVNIFWADTTTYTAAPGAGSTWDFSGVAALTLGDIIGGDVTLDSVTGGDSSLGITGLAVTGGTGGAVAITGGATTTSGVGGLVTATGGAGSGTNNGGAVSITGGASGSGATGNGGAVGLTGGAAASTNGTGGAVVIVSGAGNGTGASGAASLQSAAGDNGTTGQAGASGAINIITGTGGTATTGLGGATGAITIQTPAGGATSGAAGQGASAGRVFINAGNGGADSEGGSGIGGNGGAVVLTAGNAGAGATPGVPGQVHLRSGTDSPVLIKHAAAATTTADADTLTVAELFNGFFTIDIGSYSAGTLTTPTGGQISAALGTNLQIGDSFEFTLISLCATGEDVTLTAGASGVTIVGSAIVYPDIDAAADHSGGSSGTWCFVNTASDTWVAYRK